MKKCFVKLLLIVSVLMTLFLMSETAFADTSNTEIEWTDGVSGGAIYFDTSTGSITRSDSTITVAKIPEKINGVKVESIGIGAFYYCTSLTEITLPDSLTKIGYNAFVGCTSLKSLRIPGGVDTIANGTLYNCKSLTEIEIPNGVKTIEYEAFRKCNSLTEIRIPSSVISIDTSAFLECTNMEAIDVEDENENYKSVDGVLYNQNIKKLLCCPEGKKEVTIPVGVTYIGEYSFQQCDKLVEIDIPYSVQSIMDFAFLNCTSLRNVQLHEGLTKIDAMAFWYCESLKKITIPNTVTEIGGNAFSSCESLKEVVLPENISAIEGAAFSECSSLEEITIPPNVDKINDALFEDCKSLKKVTLPDGVKEIGDDAFSGCESLKRVVLPDSVKKIGDYAFAKCTSLSRFDIPDGVASIGECAFYACSSLEKIKIPEGITCIPESCFMYCKSLKKITIPDTVTYIGDCAFWECDTLDGVELNDSMTYIGGSAFFECKSLRKISLPQNLKKIESCTFEYCSSLCKVVIPNGVTSIGDEAFCGCPLNKLIIPSSVKSIGLSILPNWYLKEKNCIVGEKNSCAEEYANNNGLIFIPFEENELKKIQSNKYGVYVVDSSDDAISGATVNLDGTSLTTDYNGLALFDEWTIGTPSISVSKSGYETWTNQNINYEKSGNGYEKVVLYTTEEAKLKVVKALYNDETNLCIKTKKLTLPSDLPSGKRTNDMTFSLTIQTRENVATRTELWQNSKLIATADKSGTFNGLKASNFSEGGGVCIKTYDAEKNSYITPINLIFVDLDIKDIEDIEFEMGGGDLQFTIPDDSPLFPGRNIKIKGFEKSPVVVKYKDDTIYFLINYPKVDKDTNPQLSDDLAENVDRLLNIPSGSFTKENLPTIKNLFKEVGEEKAHGNFSVKFFGCGSIKAEELLSESQVGINLYVKITASGTATSQVMVWIVPLTCNCTLEGSIKGEIKAELDLQKKEVSGELAVEGSIGLSGFVGVGVGEVASVGFYGSGEITADVVFFSTNEEAGLRSAVLSGDLGVKGYIFYIESENPIIKGEYYLYTRTSNPKAKKLRAVARNQALNQIYDIDSYTIQDVSYLVNESSWLGEESGSSMLRSLRAVSSSEGIEIKQLLTNTYENMMPTIAASDDAMVIAYLRADTNRSVYNMLQIMYSVYDSTTGTWGKPKTLDSADVTSDYAPNLFSDGKDIFLVYQDSCKELDADSSTLSEYAKSQVIKVAVFDPETQTFVNATELSPNDEDGSKYHSQPRLGLVNNVPTAAWVANSDVDDVFGQNTSNEIWISQYADGTWSQATQLTNSQNCIKDLRMINKGIVYMSDNDNALATSDDISLKLLDVDGNIETIAIGKLSGLKVSDVSGEEVLSWLGEDGLYKYSDTAELMIADFAPVEYYLTDEGVFFTSSVDSSSSNIYKAVYDAETKAYQGSVAITTSEKYVENVELTEYNDETYAVLVNSEVTIGEETIDRVCDLAWCKLSEVTDLTLVEAYYEQSDVAAGSELPIQMNLKNKGTTTIDSATVEITDVSGNVVSTSEVSLGLASGEEKEITVNLTLPETITKSTYNISVSAGVQDRDFSDNMSSIIVGYTDLALSYEMMQVGNRQSIGITVANEGFSASTGTLTISYGGEAVYETEVEELASGERTTFMIGLSDLALSSGESGTIEISVTATEEEMEFANNKENVYLNLDYNINFYTVDDEGSEKLCMQVNKLYDEDIEVRFNLSR